MQPSYASSRATPVVPTDTAGEAGNMVDAQMTEYLSNRAAAMPDVPQPPAGHPANSDGHGAGALGYQGFQDGELSAIGGQ
jgi:hypothetical protein